MKLEIKSSERHKLHADSKWTFKENRLEQRIACSLGEQDHLEYALSPGENIRIDGEIYHVERQQLTWFWDKENRKMEVIFVYELKKGEFRPPEWLKIWDG